MDLLITSASQAPDPELRALRMWLADGAGMRGRIRFRSQPAPPGGTGGAAGATVAALALTAEPGEDVTALVRWITSWLRLRLDRLHHEPDATIAVTSSAGATITVSARLTGTWTPAQLDAQIDVLARRLERPVTSPPAGPAQPPASEASGLGAPRREQP